MIWDLRHIAVPCGSDGPIPVLLVLDREHERLLLAVTVPDPPALVRAADASVNQCGSPVIVRSLRHQGARELDEAYLARLQKLGCSPRLVTLAAVSDTRWVDHAAVSVLAAIIANTPTAPSGLDSLLTQLCWTPWPTPDD